MCLIVHWLASNDVIPIFNVFLECYGNTDNLCHFCICVLHTLCVTHPHCYVCVLIDFVIRFCVDGMYWIHFYLHSIPSVCMYLLIVCLSVVYMQVEAASFMMKNLFIWTDSYGERKKKISVWWRKKWVFQPSDPCTYEVCSRNVLRTLPIETVENLCTIA